MRKLYRCRWDKKIAGVCGGIGQFLKIDPSIVRVIFIFLTSATGFFPGIIIYALLAFLIPVGPAIYVEIPGKKLYKSISDRKLTGLLGGIAEYISMDSTFVRIVYLVVTCATAFIPGILTYIIGASLLQYPSSQK